MNYLQDPIRYHEFVRWFADGEMGTNVEKMRQVDTLATQWASLLTRQSGLK